MSPTDASSRVNTLSPVKLRKLRSYLARPAEKLTRKVAISAVLILVAVVLIGALSLSYSEDSCYYQLSRLETQAALDEKLCSSRNAPVSFKITNQGKYD